MSLQKPSQDMLYRYTQRKLSEEEEEQVELWLMENPEGLEEVRLDLSLKALSGGHIKSREDSRMRNRFLRMFALPAFAFVTGVSTAFLAWHAYGPYTNRGGNGLSFGTLHALTQTRSTSTPQIISTVGKAPIVLRIDLPKGVEVGHVLTAEISKNGNSLLVDTFEATWSAEHYLVITQPYSSDDGIPFQLTLTDDVERIVLESTFILTSGDYQ